MKIECRASLETGNVTADPVGIRRRPPSVWEASSEREHRVFPGGMILKYAGLLSRIWRPSKRMKIGDPVYLITDQLKIERPSDRGRAP